MIIQYLVNLSAKLHKKTQLTDTNSEIIVIFAPQKRNILSNINNI